MSDDTIYTVLDYLYKRIDYQISKVTFLNFTMVNGISSHLKQYIGTPEELAFRKQNDEVIKSIISEVDINKDLIIAGWGNYSPVLESVYKKRIREVMSIIGDKPIFRVGPMVNKSKYPGHGKLWYDYEELLPYPLSAVK